MTRVSATDEEINGPPSPLPHNSCLGVQRNLPSPDVSRCLPAELLSSVFIHIARDSYCWYDIDGKCTSYSTPTAPNWVYVSYVCRYWRDVALSCPTLWSYIPTTSRRWTQELLARSQMAPLKISTKVTSSFRRVQLFYPHQEHKAQMLSIVEQVMNHSQRIQKLCLDIDQEASCLIMSKFPFAHFSCLQHLEISDFHLQEGKFWLLFKENTPTLRTLRLKCCSMRWHSPEPSVLVLTTLHLSNAGIYIYKKTMADFLSMLRRMPHLVQLSVNESLPSARDFLSNGKFGATPMISLSRLSNMSITMVPLSTAIALLSCVDIPSRTKIHLRILSEYTFDHISALGNYVRLTSLLGQRICQSNYPNLRSLIIGNPWQIALAFSTSERVECYSPDPFSSIGSDNTLLKVDFVHDLPMRRWREPDCPFLSSIYSPIPLTKIQSVHFLGPSVSLEFWRKMLASLSDVRHIRFSGYDMPNITSMISLPSHHLMRSRKDGRAEKDQGEIFVPALEELELYQTTLRLGTLLVGPYRYVAEVQALYDAIFTRKETQCRLSIKECRLATDASVVEAFESVGCWEGAEFRVTSNVRYVCVLWKARQACSLLWSGVLLLRSIVFVLLYGLLAKILP